jgi:hypothetical protein
VRLGHLSALLLKRPTWCYAAKRRDVPNATFIKVATVFCMSGAASVNPTK